MGCDIHAFVEVKPQLTSTDWRMLEDSVFRNPFFQEDRLVSIYNVPYGCTVLDQRNYALFSLLADVRNTRALSNPFNSAIKYEERDAIIPIQSPRGIPRDASEGWIKELKRWGADLHSHSYFTLQELLDAESHGAFDQKVLQRGYVSLDQYLGYAQKGLKPSTWASYTSGPSLTALEWEVLSQSEKDAYCKQSEDHAQMICIRTSWEWDLRDALGDLLRTIEELKVNAPRTHKSEVKDMSLRDRQQALLRGGDDVWDYDYTRIRIVFAFDN